MLPGRSPSVAATGCFRASRAKTVLRRQHLRGAGHVAVSMHIHRVRRCDGRGPRCDGVRPAGTVAAPPAYIELVFAQMCMRAAHDRFGAPAITFDEMVERPASARRELAAWLRGAGNASPSAGLSLVGEASGPEVEAPSWAESATETVESWTAEAEASAVADTAEVAKMSAGAYVAAEATASAEVPLHVIDGGSAPISEVDFRELYYSQAGGFQQSWQTPGAPDWLGQLRRRRLIAGRDVGALVGRNTYVGLSEAAVRTELPTLMVALARGGAGTRVTVVTGTGLEEELHQAGFELLGRLMAADGTPRVAMAAGRRRGVWRKHRLDHVAVREHLDRLGCEMLEVLLTEFGVEWAPHKQRGPCSGIEFLGMRRRRPHRGGLHGHEDAARLGPARRHRSIAVRRDCVRCRRGPLPAGAHPVDLRRDGRRACVQAAVGARASQSHLGGPDCAGRCRRPLLRHRDELRRQVRGGVSYEEGDMVCFESACAGTDGVLRTLVPAAGSCLLPPLARITRGREDEMAHPSARFHGLLRRQVRGACVVRGGRHGVLREHVRGPSSKRRSPRTRRRSSRSKRYGRPSSNPRTSCRTSLAPSTAAAELIETRVWMAVGARRL
jgi:hypothetical protein